LQIIFKTRPELEKWCTLFQYGENFRFRLSV